MRDYEYSTWKEGKFITVPKIDDLCLVLKEKFYSQAKENERLIEENRRIKNEKYASEELTNMKKELNTMKKEYYNGFPISEEERNLINKWKKKHEEEDHNAKTFEQKLKLEGVSGGRYSYHFVPTTIGTSGTIRCSCGAEFEFQKIE